MGYIWKKLFLSSAPFWDSNCKWYEKTQRSERVSLPARSLSLSLPILQRMYLKKVTSSKKVVNYKNNPLKICNILLVDHFLIASNPEEIRAIKCEQRRRQLERSRFSASLLIFNRLYLLGVRSYQKTDNYKNDLLEICNILLVDNCL